MPGKKITVFNPTAAPLVYSEDGRTLGGGERREVDNVDAVGQGLLDSGALIDVTPAPKQDEALPEEAAPARTPGTKKAVATRSGAPDQEDHA